MGSDEYTSARDGTFSFQKQIRRICVVDKQKFFKIKSCNKHCGYIQNDECSSCKGMYNNKMTKEWCDSRTNTVQRSQGRIQIKSVLRDFSLLCRCQLRKSIALISIFAAICDISSCNKECLRALYNTAANCSTNSTFEKQINVPYLHPAWRKLRKFTEFNVCRRMARALCLSTNTTPCSLWGPPVKNNRLMSLVLKPLSVMNCMTSAIKVIQRNLYGKSERYRIFQLPVLCSQSINLLHLYEKQKDIFFC